MRGKSFYERIKDFGVWRLIKAKDFIITILFLLVVSILYPSAIMTVNEKFLDLTTQLAMSLIAIILATFAILISISGKEFIDFLKGIKIRNGDLFSNIVFNFEWNIYLTVIVALLGILIQSFSVNFMYPFFVFSFIYMILSVLSLISFVAYYGLRKGEFIHATSKNK